MLYADLGCAGCHSTPPAGNAIWTNEGRTIDLFDSANNGYNDFQGNAIPQGLETYLPSYMPPFGTQPTPAEAQQIIAYMVDAVDVGVSWCPGEDFPPSQQSSSSSVSSSSSSSSSLSSSSEPNGNDRMIYAINAGGSAINVSDGYTYEAGAPYVKALSGDHSKTPNPIANTEDDELYQTQRYGVFTYELPVTTGHYNITLMFAEQYTDEVGVRVMTVKAEDQNIVSNFDLFKTAGFEVAHTETINNVEVTDGSLSIAFTASANYATVSGILVTSADGDKGELPEPEAACDQGNMTICTDFEGVSPGGIPAGFDGLGSNARVVNNEEAHSGTSSLKFSAGSYGEGFLKKNNVSGSHWGRIYYKIKTPTPTANGNSVLHASFVALRWQNYEARIVDTVQQNGNKTHQYLYNVQIDNAGEGGKSTSYDWSFDSQWVCAEWHIDNQTQTYEFFHNGTRIDSISGNVTYPNTNSLPNTFDWIGFGIRVYQNNAGFEGWMDDIAVGPQRIGCD